MTEATKKITPVAKLQAQLDKLKARIPELHKELDEAEAAVVALTAAIEEQQKAGAYEAAIIQGLPAGTPVVYEFGRDKTRATFQGSVLAFKTEDGKTTYRIETGEGFDKVIHTVPAAAVKGYGSPSQAEADPLAEVQA